MRGGAELDTIVSLGVKLVFSGGSLGMGRRGGSMGHKRDPFMGYSCDPFMGHRGDP